MILYTAANNWYGSAMSESLLYEKKIDRNVKLKDTLNIPMIVILVISLKLILEIQLK